MSTESSRLQVPSGSVDSGPARPAGDADTRVAGPVDVAAASLQGRRQGARQSSEKRSRSGGARTAKDPSRARPDHASDAARRSAPSRRKRKVRKVHRVVRHIEVWSVAKLAAVFVACGYVVAMVSGYLLWRAADRVGTIDGIEGFMEDSGGYERFEILGDVVFRAAAGIGVVLAVLTVGVIILGVVLFNLISDLTGGIRMTAIDEDLVVTPARRPPPAPPTEPSPTRPG